VDTLAAKVTDWLYDEFRAAQNARGGRIQVALYSFVVNHMLGEVVGASPDGRHARQVLNRNLNPAWGASRNGPTAVLRSLSVIDFTKFPNGTALDLRFDPTVVATREGRRAFAGFLRGFVDLKVMQIQITMADTKTLRDAQRHPEKYTDLMVKVAGYSARFIDLTPQEQKEIIARSEQRL
jgi:formate C-acetyltransferase